MKDQEDDGDEEMMKEKKIDFLGGFDALFRERTPYDMLKSNEIIIIIKENKM